MTPFLLALLFFWAGGVCVLLSLSVMAARIEGRRWPEAYEFAMALGWPVFLLIPVQP